MKIEITGITVIDDGTLDTVIGVSGNLGYKEFRYNIEHEENETREDIIRTCKALAEEDYIDSAE